MYELVSRGGAGGGRGGAGGGNGGGSSLVQTSDPLFKEAFKVLCKNDKGALLKWVKDHQDLEKSTRSKAKAKAAGL